MTDDSFVIDSLHFHVNPSQFADGFRQPPLQFETVVAACAEDLDFHAGLLLSCREKVHCEK
jgi:hypothetical protein